MPDLQETFTVLDHDSQYSTEFVSPETLVGRKLDRVEPELGLGVVPLDVNVRRLPSLVREEVKTVRSDRCDPRHDILPEMLAMIPSADAPLPLASRSPHRHLRRLGESSPAG